MGVIVELGYRKAELNGERGREGLECLPWLEETVVEEQDAREERERRAFVFRERIGFSLRPLIT